MKGGGYTVCPRSLGQFHIVKQQEILKSEILLNPHPYISYLTHACSIRYNLIQFKLILIQFNIMLFNLQNTLYLH